MATVTVSPLPSGGGLDFTDTTFLDLSGVVDLNVTSTRITISYENGSINRYDGSGFTTDGLRITAGVVTSAEYLESGTVFLSITEISFSAVTVDNFYVVNNGAGLFDFLLAGSDQINGSAESEILSGGAGDDILVGGVGNDFLDGGAGADTVDYSTASGLVIVNLASDVSDDGDGGIDNLIGIENIIGSAFNDIIVGDDSDNVFTGGSGNDRMDGRAGNDTLMGGGGNDIYTIGDTGDIVTELSGGGNDRINVFVDFVNSANVEFMVGKFASVGLTLTGNDEVNRITGSNKINSGDTISGEGGNDKLVGLNGNDNIQGGAGNDRIFGNSGADILTGGLGNDRLTGQQGVDVFVHASGDGSDRITDFTSAVDDLDLTGHGFSSFAEVQALTSLTGGGTLIDLAGSDSIFLENFVGTLLIGDVLI